jgi:hypothetical protein
VGDSRTPKSGAVGPRRPQSGAGSPEAAGVVRPGQAATPSASPGQGAATASSAAGGQDEVNRGAPGPPTNEGSGGENTPDENNPPVNLDRTEDAGVDMAPAKAPSRVIQDMINLRRQLKSQLSFTESFLRRYGVKLSS